MGKVVGPGLPQAALFVTEPLPDRIEEFSLLLLKGDQPVGAEDDADLLGDKTVIRVLTKQPENDVKIRVVILAFRPLFRVQDVFKDHRMEAEDASHLLEEVDILEAVNVNPGDARPVGRGQNPVQSGNLLFPEIGFIVLAEGDFHILRMLLPDMNQKTGRETGFGGSFLCRAGLCVSGHVLFLRTAFIMLR